MRVLSVKGEVTVCQEVKEIVIELPEKLLKEGDWIECGNGIRIYLKTPLPEVSNEEVNEILSLF